MNKTAIKNYAIWARVQLIESCKQRAFEYGVTEDGNYASNLKTIGSRILTEQEVEQRNQLISQIKQKGYTQVIEEGAYTWFNRFIALRFMEVNGYLPSKVRVFTDETGAFKPEILKEAMTIDLEGIDRARVIDLLEKQDNEGLYKYLLITQCNALSGGLPYMFEKISNWTELLFPANLLRNDSVAGRMVTDIPEEDWTDAVQIIGWLYQYYNSELKDETFALLKKNVKITKERIPAATQLFTPDWIVRYMVENSLGRLWYEGHKDFDKSQWKYYLDEVEQEPEVEAELAKIRAEYSQIKPEEIKVIDPCMGSGHILVYAFDVLMQIYTSAGWSERDAARSIIENNIYGLDIDDRAGQLAYFAVMMKARKYSRRIMSLDIKPNVMSIQDSSFMTDGFIDFVADDNTAMKSDLRQIREIFTDAKEYGSILNVLSLNYSAILGRIDTIQDKIVEDIFQTEYKTIASELLQPLIKQAMIMSQKYDVVVTNPPYMGASGMSDVLSSFVKKNYPDSKSDLFAVFIDKGFKMLSVFGFESMITMESWMFLSSFEKLRSRLLSQRTISTLIHMPYLGKGNTSLGINFGTEMAVIRNYPIRNYLGVYSRIAYYETNDEGIPVRFPTKNKFFKYQDQASFLRIPGTPISYWASENLIEAFEKNQTIADYGDSRSGLQTSDNNRFLRLWFEVAFSKIAFNCNTRIEAESRKEKWYPITKGGAFRKWYGNLEYIVNWEKDGRELFEFAKTLYGSPTRIIKNTEYYFEPCITWSHTTSKNIFAARWISRGMLFNVEAPSLFRCKDNYYIIAALNSVVTNELFKLTNQTFHFLAGDVAKLPIKYSPNEAIDALSKNNIEISKRDWDSFETSWDFKKHPLI